MSRIEEYLMNCCEMCGCEGLPAPITNTDKLLHHLASILEGGGGGGASSWNDLKDKPFYEETVEVGGDTLTWDGNTEGLESASGAGLTWYKLSDVVPTKDDCVNGISVCLHMSDGSEMPIDVDGGTVQSMFRDDGSFAVETMVLIIPADNYLLVPNTGASVQFQKAGIYFLESDGMYTSNFTIPGYDGFKTVTTTIKPIPSKYLPEHLQFGEEKAFEPIVWDGNTEGLESIDGMLTKVAEEPICADPFLIESITTRLYESGEEGVMLISYVAEQGMIASDEHGFIIGDGFVVCSDGHYAFGGLSFGKGTWVAVQSGVRYISTITPATTIKPLDEKYLPTLTSPSGKKFKLSVDDSGTISATEV